MKISRVIANSRRKAFEVCARGQTYVFPYAVCRPRPAPENRVVRTWIDPELGSEGFGYRLASGSEGCVHIDHVLEYNRDPRYVADMLLYRLTLEAQTLVARSPLSTREIIRRLRTSPAQFYRLLDQTNYRKSLRQMLSLLHVLDCEVTLTIRRRKTA